MSPDLLVQRAQQSNISDADSLALTVARRCVEERLRARTGASFRRWNCESPWFVLNRCIARADSVSKVVIKERS
jgi:hypothetical protein